MAVDVILSVTGEMEGEVGQSRFEWSDPVNTVRCTVKHFADVVEDIGIHVGDISAVEGAKLIQRVKLMETSGPFADIHFKLADMPREEIHDIFGMVLQDTWIFEGSIKENILFSKTGVSEDRLDEICKEAGIYHYVHTLPGGLDYVLENESSVSGGQRQMITIARAMAENAPLLILDEATSNVDTRTEELIQRSMDKLVEGRTSFVIAHRLSTIRNADLILVMKDGNIIEQGTHDELISQNGFYAGLYNSQFAGEGV